MSRRLPPQSVLNDDTRPGCMREEEHFNLKDIEEAVGVPLSMKASNALHHEQYEIYDY
mgnify:CR=1 FL=1